MTSTEKPRHSRIKWLQFAGRLLVAIAAFLVVWIPYQRQMRLIEEIEAVGGVVGTQQVGPDWLRKLVGDERMKGVNSISAVSLNVPVDDAWLKRLGRLSNLRWLELNGTQISDDGLKHLAELTNITELRLNNTHIGNEGLKHLTGLTRLRWLSLNNTQVSNDGLKHLVGLTDLTELRLNNTRISNDGLKHLAELFSLEILYLGNTLVSDAGVKELQQALPKCEISR